MKRCSSDYAAETGSYGMSKPALSLLIRPVFFMRHSAGDIISVESGKIFCGASNIRNVTKFLRSRESGAFFTAH